MSGTTEFKPLLVVPSYDGNIGAQTVKTATGARCQFATFVSSALCYNYNNAWCSFLNDPSYSHFAMLHADVEATGWPGEGTWIEWMAGEMDTCGIECLSVVNAIKDRSGTTSVALGTLEPFGAQRLAFKNFPEGQTTFSDAQCEAATGKVLLVNTGLMVVKRADWNDRFSFEFHDRITKDDEGKFVPEMSPEDWNMSRWFKKNGVPYGVTNGVRTLHHGAIDFPNYDDGTGLYL